MAAFKIFCKIKPTDGKKICRVPDAAPVVGSVGGDKGGEKLTKNTGHGDGGGSGGIASAQNGSSSNAGGISVSTGGGPSMPSLLCPMLGAAGIPEVEQTMRLISYQGMARRVEPTVHVVHWYTLLC